MVLSRSPEGLRTGASYDVAQVRADFPILGRTIRNHPLVYLDSAASAQKPARVIASMSRMMEEEYANIHRGVHHLSARATERFEGARETVREFINARTHQEIVFTRGATEAINLVAATFGRTHLREGDEIILSELEHHANIVPWQLLRSEKGIVIKVIPITDRGELIQEAYHDLFSDRTRLVAISHMSNALGTINPVAEMIAYAHERGVPVLVDGCQAITHQAVDVQALDCDFYVFSAHKLYGPTGIGVLYGKMAIMKDLPPYQGGGDMINRVSFAETTFKAVPQRFEAGTPAIVEAIGFGEALAYLSGLGMAAIAAHEADLLAYAEERVKEIKGLQIIGTAAHKASILSFTLERVHPHDIGTILDHAGVAIRAGHHCAQPLMERMGVAATARASFGLYNTREDVDALVSALRTVQEIFG